MWTTEGRARSTRSGIVTARRRSSPARVDSNVPASAVAVGDTVAAVGVGAGAVAVGLGIATPAVGAGRVAVAVVATRLAVGPPAEIFGRHAIAVARGDGQREADRDRKCQEQVRRRFMTLPSGAPGIFGRG